MKPVKIDTKARCPSTCTKMIIPLSLSFLHSMAYDIHHFNISRFKIMIRLIHLNYFIYISSVHLISMYILWLEFKYEKSNSFLLFKDWGKCVTGGYGVENIEECN
jgi:hypothetical protein